MLLRCVAFSCIVVQLVDYRVEFSKWWVSEFKTVKFPSQGSVFDYFIDVETKKWTPWIEKVPKYEHDPEVPLQVSACILVCTCIYPAYTFTLYMTRCTSCNHCSIGCVGEHH